MDIKERLENFKRKYANKDYMVLRVKQEQGAKVGINHQESVDALIPFFANSSVDYSTMIPKRIKEGAKVIAGNFVNLKDERVQQMKSLFDMVGGYINDKDFEPSTDLIASKKTEEKLDEVKKRLGK